MTTFVLMLFLMLPNSQIEAFTLTQGMNEKSCKIMEDSMNTRIATVKNALVKCVPQTTL